MHINPIKKFLNKPLLSTDPLNNYDRDLYLIFNTYYESPLFLFLLINLDKQQQIELFIDSCENNNLLLCDKLHKIFKYTKEQLCNDKLLINVLCMKGNLEMLKYVIVTFDLKKEDIVDGFELCCENNHLNVATYLNEYYHLTKNDIKNSFFLMTVNNYMDLTKWLIDTFDLTKKSNIDNNLLLESFNQCCINNLVTMVGFLIDIFKFKLKDMNNKFNTIFNNLTINSIKTGNYDMCNLLIDKLKLNEKDLMIITPDHYKLFIK